jgi:regulator of replication initiation timing
MSISDSRSIAIGIVIGLLVGGGLGYLIPQSEINELQTQVLALESQVVDLEDDVSDCTDALHEAEEENNDLNLDIEDLESTIENLTEEIESLDTELSDYKQYYQEMWDDYNDLIQDYNDISNEPVGQMSYVEVSGVLNGEFDSEGDWVKQGKGGIGWGEAQLHQYDTFSTFLSQNIYLDSNNLGIKFDVKPEPLGGSVGLQVSIGDIQVYDETYTGSNSAFDYETVVIPLKTLLDMREFYELTVEDYYALKFTIPAGPESGAIVKIDNVSLVSISYQPEQPPT